MSARVIRASAKAVEAPSTPVRAEAPAVRASPAPRRRKPWLLKHTSDVRSLIFLGVYFALMAFQWRYDAAIWAMGPIGWLACSGLWAAQLWFAAIAVRAPPKHCAQACACQARKVS